MNTRAFHALPWTTLAALALLTLVACDSPGGRSGAGVALPTCHNGALDTGEVCDGTLVGDNTCQTAGYERGVLICNTFCTNFDYSGCSGGDPADTTIGQDTTTPADTSSPADTTSPVDTIGPQDTSAPVNRAPELVTISSNKPTLNAGESLIITATVTDPDGVDDLAGGSLVDADSGASYGAFTSGGAAGSFALTLTWGALGAVEAIDAPPSGVGRSFRAVFLDKAGAKAEGAVDVTLRCDGGDTKSLCAGHCADLQTDSDHCGGCGQPVPAGKICKDGAPADGTVAPTATTIAALQSSSASINCTEDGDQIITENLAIEGVVTVGRFEINGALAGYFVSDGSQDPYSAVMVRFLATDGHAFAVGERVRVVGHHAEYYCHTQFSADSVTSIGSGSVPTPVALTNDLTPAQLEPYEGMTVSFFGVYITGHNAYGQAETDAGVLIDDAVLGDFFVIPAIDSTIAQLRGALGWRFGTYRVSPRSQTDY